MMTPDDARHGTHRGYVVGCRMLCCTAAQTRYMKLYRMGRIPRLIDPLGTVRRIRALQALGWTYRDMGEACGKGEVWAYMIPRSKQVTTTTADQVISAYERLCMTVPPGPYAERTRRLAKRKGWPPPLAWLDIDDPDEQPGDWEYQPRVTGNQFADDFDPVVVQRLLEGDRIPSTRTERAEALATWVANGGTERELCLHHGWKSGRYKALTLVRGGAA